MNQTQSINLLNSRRAFSSNCLSVYLYVYLTIFLCVAWLLSHVDFSLLPSLVNNTHINSFRVSNSAWQEFRIVHSSSDNLNVTHITFHNKCSSYFSSHDQLFGINMVSKLGTWVGEWEQATVSSSSGISRQPINIETITTYMGSTQYYHNTPSFKVSRQA